MNDFTEEEVQLVLSHRTAEQQLYNLRRVMRSSVPPKKLKKLETVDLPFCITKEFNLRQQVEHLMKKKGYIRK